MRYPDGGFLPGCVEKMKYFDIIELVFIMSLVTILQEALDKVKVELAREQMNRKRIQAELYEVEQRIKAKKLEILQRERDLIIAANEINENQENIYRSKGPNRIAGSFF